MIPKGPGCSGCPFEAMGSFMVPDELREQAPVLVMGQNPGDEEEAQGRPFIGMTGEVWERKYLPLAGLTREDVSIGNIIRCRVGGSNELPTLASTDLRSAIQHCQRAYYRQPEGTRAIVTQGAYALQGLTGERDVDSWRGYALDMAASSHLVEPWAPRMGRDVPVLATMHLARLFCEPTLTLATMADWAKLARLLKGTWPRKPPAFTTHPPAAWPKRFTFDTEFDRQTKWLQRWSMAYRGLQQEPVVKVVERSKSLPPVFTGSEHTAVSQYTPADMRHLAWVSQVPWTTFQVEDTVWKHAVLYSDHPHDLNYLGSLWSSMNRWKHLSEADPLLYAGCDAWGLWEVDEALEGELRRDPLSAKVWTTIDRPAIPYFVEAQYRGLRVSARRLGEVIGQLHHEARDSQARATAIAGWPLSLASPAQVAHRLFKVERLGAKA